MAARGTGSIIFKFALKQPEIIPSYTTTILMSVSLVPVHRKRIRVADLIAAATIFLFLSRELDGKLPVERRRGFRWDPNV